MRAMVTGGAGFIGSNLVDALRARGHRVSVLDNLATGKRDNVPEGCAFFEGDVRDRDAVRRAFEEEPPELLFHLAAQADVRKSMDDPIFDLEVNVEGTLNLLEAAKRFGTGRVVFASTGGAIYGEPPLARLPCSEEEPARPLSCYGAAKRSAELYLDIYAETAGIRSTVLRFANVYGPRQNPKGEAGVVAIFSLLLLEGKRPTIFGDGSKTRDYVHVADVVRAFLLAVDNQADGTFNIGTGIRTSDAQVFEAVRQGLGVELTAIHGPRRKGEVEHIALSAARAEKGFGWRPEVEFGKGVAQTVGWYRERFGR